MRIDPTRLVKLGLTLCLALTFYKGFASLPAVRSAFDPDRFYRGLVIDAQNDNIMKQRHADYYRQTVEALKIRLKEIDGGLAKPDPDDLATRDRVALAIRKAQAEYEHNLDAAMLTGEKVERYRRLEARKARIGWTCPGPEDDGGRVK